MRNTEITPTAARRTLAWGVSGCLFRLPVFWCSATRCGSRVTLGVWRREPGGSGSTPCSRRSSRAWRRAPRSSARSAQSAARLWITPRRRTGALRSAAAEGESIPPRFRTIGSFVSASSSPRGSSPWAAPCSSRVYHSGSSSRSSRCTWWSKGGSRRLPTGWRNSPSPAATSSAFSPRTWSRR